MLRMHIKTAVLVISVLYLTGTDGHGVVKRNALQMCNLINQFTGRSCLNYNPYGCFCGYGQEGAEPLDNTDKCCKKHDDCYGEITKHCRYWYGFLIGYDYTCVDRNCICNDENPCSRSTCECDIQLAECLGQSDFNTDYQNYDRSQCL